VVRDPGNLPMVLAAFTLVQSTAKNLRLNLTSIFQQTGGLANQLSSLRVVYSVSEIKNQVVDGTEKLKSSREGISVEFEWVLLSAIFPSNTYSWHLRNVSFRYPGSKSYALRRVSFRVQQGQLCVREYLTWLLSLIPN
jgi:ABC-type transport system involved in cytochrome bd biosynthesis fused ATPase/permease subunit